MADVDATLTNNDNSKKFLFRGITNWKVTKAQPVISIPFINTPPGSTPLFRFMGQTEKVSFNFVIFNDGVDISNGTNTPTIITVDAQVVYLKDTVFTEDFDVSWNFSDNDGRFYTSDIVVVITDLNLDQRGGNPAFTTGSMTVQRGTLTPIFG